MAVAKTGCGSRLSITSTNPDPDPRTAKRASRSRLWRRLAFGAVLALGSCAGGFAGCAAWWLPDGELAGDERSGGIGEALDEVLNQGSAEPLTVYVRRHPRTHVCFVWEYGSLSGRPWPTYWRTYGLPNLTVPDGDWAVTMARAGQPPEYAVMRGNRVILSGNLGCADADRLRLRLDYADDPPSVLRLSVEP